MNLTTLFFYLEALLKKGLRKQRTSPPLQETLKVTEVQLKYQVHYQS